MVDSGQRTHFETGAERETGGKGRCDLLPLREVAYFFDNDFILRHLDAYLRNGHKATLRIALWSFVCKAYNGDTATAMLEASHQFEDGAKKYSDRNWEKGLPQHCYIDSAARHYIKWLRGDDDEHHDRAFMFNILAALWNHDHHPEMMDLPLAQSKTTSATDEICESLEDAIAYERGEPVEGVRETTVESNMQEFLQTELSPIERTECNSVNENRDNKSDWTWDKEAVDHAD